MGGPSGFGDALNAVAIHSRCYVDDPLAVLDGSDGEQRIRAAMIVLVWEALHFRLAYKRASSHVLSPGSAAL